MPIKYKLEMVELRTGSSECIAVLGAMLGAILGAVVVAVVGAFIWDREEMKSGVPEGAGNEGEGVITLGTEAGPVEFGSNAYGEETG